MSPERDSARPRIVVLDGRTTNPGDNPWDELARLGELVVHDRTPEAEVVERAAAAEIVLTNKTPLRADTLGRLPRLRFVAVLATGWDVVDVAAAAARGVPVSNVPEYATDPVAQHVFALVLDLASGVAARDAEVRRGEWSAQHDFSFWREPPLELAGRTLGIVGHGRIGARVAEIGRALGMRVVAATRSPERLPDWIAARKIGELFAESDVVSLHLPRTPETAGLVGEALLSRMKPTAFLVNTARGALVDEAALAAALRAGRLAGAALDVVSREPIDPASPLLGAPRCRITPHVAWASLEARRRLLATTVANVAAFLAGCPIHLVNDVPGCLDKASPRQAVSKP